MRALLRLLHVDRDFVDEWFFVSPKMWRSIQAKVTAGALQFWTRRGRVVVQRVTAADKGQTFSRDQLQRNQQRFVHPFKPIFCSLTTGKTPRGLKTTHGRPFGTRIKAAEAKRTNIPFMPMIARWHEAYKRC